MQLVFVPPKLMAILNRSVQAKTDFPSLEMLASKYPAHALQILLDIADSHNIPAEIKPRFRYAGIESDKTSDDVLFVSSIEINLAA